MIKLTKCLSCDAYFEATDTNRCASCIDVLEYRQLEGSRIVVGVLSQRELARIKREFYQAEQVVSALEERKAEFMRMALAEAEKLVQEVEAQLGQPVAELSQKRDLLKTKLQEFMSESGQHEMRIRNLFLELKNEIVNPANRPQPTKIYEELRKLADISKEELQEIIRANYSIPQWGEKLHITKLPTQKKAPPTPTGGTTPPVAMAKYEVRELDLATLAEIQQDFAKTAAENCRVESEEGVYILTGKFVRENGIDNMIGIQKRTKRALKIADMEQREDGSILMLIEGPYVNDPNTIRAFVAERAPGHEIRDTVYPSSTRIALELAPQSNDMSAGVFHFFEQIDHILSRLMVQEQARGQIAMGVGQYITGANQMDQVDNVDDLSTKYENEASRGGGPPHGSRPEEGI